MSGSAGTLSVTITGVDRLSSVFQRITGTADRFGKRMSSVGDRLHRGLALDRLTRGAQGASRALSAMVPAIGVLTAAGTLAGVARLTSSFATFGAQLGRDASRISTTVSNLSALQGAARLAGSSAADLTSGMVGLGDALTDAVGGRDDTAAQYFRMLGINMRDATGRARAAADVLPEVADGIKRIADPALQARVMAALRLPAGMSPFLRDGAAGIEQYRREAARLNPLNEAGARAARSFELAFARLGMASEGVGNTIAARLEPVLVPLLARLTEWLATSGPGFADTIGRIAESFAKWVDGGGLNRLGTAIDGIFTGIGRVVDAMGGWENAAIGLGVVLTANLLSPLLKITGAFGSILAFRPPVWMLRLLGVAGVAVGAKLALDELGRQRNDSPEQQQENRRRMGERGRLGGFYDGPATDPGDDADDAAKSFIDRLTEFLSRSYSGRLGGPARASSFGSRGAMAPGTAGPLPPAIPGQGPRGIRNNNPLNLMHVPGQTGLDPSQPSDGRFGRYVDMESGIAQSVRQMQIHAQRRGADTLERMIGLWAPPSENDTGGYISRVERETGIGRSDRLDLNDAEQLRRIIASMARVENGRSLDPSVVERGVNQGLGIPNAPAPAAAQAAGGTSRMDVRITLAGPGSEGATITSRSDDGGVRIQRPSLGVTP